MVDDAVSAEHLALGQDSASSLGERTHRKLLRAIDALLLALVEVAFGQEAREHIEGIQRLILGHLMSRALHCRIRELVEDFDIAGRPAVDHPRLPRRLDGVVQLAHALLIVRKRNRHNVHIAGIDQHLERLFLLEDGLEDGHHRVGELVVLE